MEGVEEELLGSSPGLDVAGRVGLEEMGGEMGFPCFDNDGELGVMEVERAA